MCLKNIFTKVLRDDVIKFLKKLFIKSFPNFSDFDEHMVLSSWIVNQTLGAYCGHEVSAKPRS